MVQVKDLTELTLEERWSQVKDEEEWWDEIKPRTLNTVKRLLESAMESEMIDELLVARYRRTEFRRGYRNGYRYRSLLTDLGPIERIRIPRDREGRYQTEVLPRYQRRQARVNEMVREMFLAGVSTRRVREVIKPLLGDGVSAQTVSRICRSLDEEVQLYHSRKLDDRYRYLLLDGIVLRVKGAAEVKRRVVLCAYGITHDGVRELIDFRRAYSEGTTMWTGFLDNLYRRGLTGDNLEPVSTDGAGGLHSALDHVYPFVPRQRCWAHKMRNVAAKLPRKHQDACLAEAKTIYEAHTRREALLRFRQWAAHWRSIAPKAVRCIENDLDELLPFLDCPGAHWKKVRTTNAIERAFREVRRRTRPMSCFQNSASVERITFGVISHLNTNWKDTPLLQFTRKS